MVWIVMRVCDYEYGCREIDAVFDNLKSANEYVEKHANGNNEMPLWSGRIVDTYVVESWAVRE